MGSLLLSKLLNLRKAYLYTWYWEMSAVLRLTTGGAVVHTE